MPDAIELGGTSAFDAEWLVSRRWFRAKRRPVAAVRPVDRATLPGSAAELLVLEVEYRDGGRRDLYLVPAIDGREPADGEGAWSALAAAIADELDLRAAVGTFVCRRTDASADLLPARGDAAALSERRLSVEQSNSSVVLGGTLILKLYRLLEPGASPDLEVSAFLTAAGFADTPRLAGSVTYSASDGEPAAAAMLQELVDAAGDAWHAMLLALQADPEDAVAHARAIGAVTAGLHRALGSRPEHPDFPARVASVEDAAAWRASAERQLAEAVSAVSGESHDRLVQLAPALRAAFADAFGTAAGRARVSRIHGDYHLGQLLARRDGRFSVIDFEGEPARPLAERRAPSSPLRDVAGMLRSLDYAARTAARTPGRGPLGPGVDPDAWLAAARDAFLDAYGGVGPDDGPLLAAFEVEKACYEVRYEANNRPDWLWLPLAAVDRLASR